VRFLYRAENVGGRKYEMGVDGHGVVAWNVDRAKVSA